MIPTLVRGKAIICRIDTAGKPVILEDAAIRVIDGTIAEIGDYAEFASRYKDHTVVGSSEHVICPGFVNAHHHVGLTPLQMGSPDLPLELWTISRIAGRPVDPYLDTMYSAFEMIESGVTTVQHLHGRVPR